MEGLAVQQKGLEDQKASYLLVLNFCVLGSICYIKEVGGYHINSCETTEMFYPIRTDLDKLKYASHVAKIINDVTNENENSFKILQLLLNTLYTISETNKNMDLVLATFKLRLSHILGYTPEINKCISCEREDKLNHFSIKDNGLKCDSCGRIDKSAINISDGTKDAIRYSILAPAKKIFSFQVTDNCLKELELVSKLYLNQKLEKEYKLEDIF